MKIGCSQVQNIASFNEFKTDCALKLLITY